jgi:hypothetical protein
MSEGTELSKLGSEVLRLFFMLARSISRNRTPDDYFTLLPADPRKPYIELQRLIDGKSYQCYSVKDIERSLSEVIRTTDIYNNLILHANTPDGIHAGDVFTPDLFNRLGGYQSDILLNTKEVSVRDEKSVQLHFLKGASEKGCHALSVEKQHTGDTYSLVFFSEQGSKEINDVKADQLIQTIKNEVLLKNKAYLYNKTNKKLFSMDEIPKDVLKQAGIKWSDLSETNRKALLEGKETAAVTITHKFGNGKKQYSRGYLQLSRTGGNRAEFMFRPVQQSMKTGRKI